MFCGTGTLPFTTATVFNGLKMSLGTGGDLSTTFERPCEGISKCTKFDSRLDSGELCQRHGDRLLFGMEGIVQLDPSER